MLPRAFRHFVLGATLIGLLQGCSSLDSAPGPPQAGNGVGAQPQVFQPGQPPVNWVSFLLPGNEEPSYGITAGPDGAIWSTQYAPQAIVRTAMDGSMSTFPTESTWTPFNIAAGPDGNVWFTTYGNKVGRVTPSGIVTMFRFASVSLGGYITSGPSSTGGRALWITAGQDGVFELSTDGSLVATFKVPTRFCVPREITEGPDGNLWFVEYESGKVARMTPTGAFSEFTIPDPQSRPVGIAAASDGNIYTSESSGGIGRLVRVTPAGVITTIRLGDYASTVALGPDGNPWFYGHSLGLGFYDTKTGRIHRKGFPPNAPGNISFSLASGADGNVWMIAGTANGPAIEAYVRLVMSVSPSSLNLTVGQSQSVSVKESKYRGEWTAVSSDTGIVTVSPGPTRRPFVLTGVGIGASIVTISDSGGNSVVVNVTVK